MNRDYLYFIGAYESKYIEVVTKILYIFKKALKNGQEFPPPSREIYDYLRENAKSHISDKSPYMEIFSTLKLAESDFKKGNAYKIINQSIIPMLKEIKHEELTLYDFLEKSATTIAFKEILRNFSDYHIMYEYLYELERFDGFLNLKTFDIIEYTKPIKDHPLYKELVLLNSGPIKKLEKEPKNTINSDLNFILIPKYDINNIENILNINFFNIKESIAPKFSHQAFYKYLTNDFIDNDKTDYLDYLKVFFATPEYHRSTLVFHCNTVCASLLLNEFRIKLFNNLSQSEIEKSKMFISSENTPLKQSNISNSIPKVLNENNYKYTKLVGDAFDYLHEISFKSE